MAGMTANSFMQKLNNPVLTDDTVTGNDWEVFEEHFISYFSVLGYNHKALIKMDGSEKLKDDNEERFLYVKLFESVPAHIKAMLKKNNDDRKGTVAWKILKDHYQPSAVNTHVMNYTSLTQMRWKKGDKTSLSRHILDAENKWNTIKGKLTDEEMVIALVLANLEKSPDIDYVRSKLTSENKNMKWNVVYDELRKVELDREFQVSREDEELKVLHTNENKREPCGVCGRKSHNTKQCWKTHTCSKCSTVGHLEKYCRVKVEPKSSPKPTKLPISFCTLACSTMINQDHPIIVDGASSNTISPVRELFTDLRSSKASYKTVTGSKLEAVAIGTLNLAVQTSENKMHVLKIKGAHYTPGGDATLISAAGLADMNHFVIHGKTEVRITLSTDLFGPYIPAKRVGNIYYLNTTNANTSRALSTVPEYLHERLGHPGEDRLKATLKATMHPWDHSNQIVKKINCEDCVLNKSERHHVSEGPHAPYATSPCQVFAADVCGPFPVSIINKFKYVVNYVDLYSKITQSYPIHSLSEVESTLRSWKAEWLASRSDKLSNVPITAFLDNATYFRGGEFGKLITDWSWNVRYCTPYAHQLHPIEAVNKQLLYVARTLLNAANMEKSFWPFAYITACYLRNRTVATREEITPIQKHTALLPELSHLRVYGCTAFVLDNTRDSKLDETARKGVFIGYARQSSHGTYRIYLPNTGKIVESRDVRFDESTYFYGHPKEVTVDSKPTTTTIITTQIGSTQPLITVDSSTPDALEPEAVFEDSFEANSETASIHDDGEHKYDSDGDYAEGADVETFDVEHDSEAKSDPADIQTPAEHEVLPAEHSNDHIQPPAPALSHEAQQLLDPAWNFIFNKDSTDKSEQSDKDSDSEHSHVSNGESKHVTFNIPEGFDHIPFSAQDDSAYALSPVFEEVYASVFMPATKRAPISTPNSYAEYLRLPAQDKELWRQAMTEEWSNLERAGTLSLVPRSKATTRPMTSKWLYKIKNNGRLKARLVVRGFGEPIENENEVYSPTPDRISMRIATIIALTLGWETRVFDVDAAFLEAQIENSDLFIYPPSGSNAPKDSVFRLDGSLYGLKSAPLRWFLELGKTLKSLGLQQSLVDPCVYMSASIIVVAYVDDCRIFGEIRVLDTFINKVTSVYAIKIVPSSETYLGQHWHYDSRNKICEIDQTEYIKDMLDKTGHSKSKAVSTPLEAGAQLKDAEESKVHPMYRMYVGKLLYLGISRPDLTFAVHQVARHCHKNDQSHFDAVKHILKYLNGTVNSTLKLRGANDLNELNITAFSDSSWGDAHDRKSTTGHVIFLGNSPVAWGSKKQSIITLSSCEAELVAIVNAVQECIEIQQICEELGINGKITVYSDSQSGISWIERGSIGKQSKHIQVRLLKLKEWIESGIFELKFVSGNHNLADIFTKALNGPRFKELTSAIMNSSVPLKL